MRYLLVILLNSALLCGGALHADETRAASKEGGGYRDAILLMSPMDVAGLDRKVADVLTRYYRSNFKNEHTWDALQSVRFEGRLHLPDLSLRFVAFKKKPDYCKVMVYHEDQLRMVLGYDGKDAWQVQAGGDVVAMPEKEALNFIRDATTGGHLFYPQLSGKTIEFKGMKPMDGVRCVELLITLPDGQQITSFLEVANYREHQQITQSAITGNREVITNMEFREYGGMYFPTRSELTVDGAQVHTVEILDVQINEGVAPWMFSRASATYLPMPSGISAAEDGQQLLVSPVQSIAPVEADFSPFAQESAFDSVEVEVESIVDQIGR